MTTFRMSGFLECHFNVIFVIFLFFSLYFQDYSSRHYQSWRPILPLSSEFKIFFRFLPFVLLLNLFKTISTIHLNKSSITNLQRQRGINNNLKKNKNNNMSFVLPHGLMVKILPLTMAARIRLLLGAPS